MTRTNFLNRLAGLAFSLLILSATSGCAHFHNAEVRAQERAGVQRAEPPVAEAVPPQPVAPEPSAPAPLASVPPAPEPVPAAAPPAPVPTASNAEPSAPAPSVAPPEATHPLRKTVPQPPVAVPPAPSPAPATNNAIIIFASTASANCVTCETLKISVAPSGQVLIERGSWAAGRSNWRYKRSRANVGPDRAAAFATSLSADRPVGAQTVGGAGCAAPAAGDDGLSIEWIEADRDDRLTVKFGCSAGASGSEAERLRHAPYLLGLRQLAFP